MEASASQERSLLWKWQTFVLNSFVAFLSVLMTRLIDNIVSAFIPCLAEPLTCFHFALRSPKRPALN